MPALQVRTPIVRSSALQTPVGPIAMFLPTLERGGAERVILTLAEGFFRRGHPVDIVVVRAAGGLLPCVPQGVRLVELGTKHVVSSVPALARYVKRERPTALLSTLNTANAVAVLAARVARQSTRVVIRQASHPAFTRSFKNSSVASAILDRAIVRWVYPHANVLVAVSSGVADALARGSRVRDAQIHVVPNPIVTQDLLRLATLPADHDWFARGSVPVILGVGRLTPVKRFDLLIRAFKRVLESYEARLVILGDGEERGRLEALVRELDLHRFVSLPGFVDNPFAYMARAKVFVLSSAFEGLPGVLIQALACGAAVVATDCDSGPREILQDGRFGELVPVGDVSALGDAIGRALTAPKRADVGEAYLPYMESAGVDAYLRVLKPVAHG